MNPPSDPLAPAVGGIDAVLLIDGDNDPHFPAEFVVSERSLVRVFLRMSATMPKPLERRLAPASNCVAVVATKTAGNAADFVMALHAGMLHATLPMQLPFTIVTNDQGLSVIAQELQRLGRQTTLWTSHTKAKRGASEGSHARATSSRRRGSRSRSRGRGRSAVAASAPLPVAEAAPIVPAAGPGSNEGRAAASYLRHLHRSKNPPSRLKSLLSDIANRAQPAGCDPRAVLELLVDAGAVTIDSTGRVKRGAHPAPASRRA